MYKQTVTQTNMQTHNHTFYFVTIIEAGVKRKNEKIKCIIQISTSDCLVLFNSFLEFTVTYVYHQPMVVIQAIKARVKPYISVSAHLCPSSVPVSIILNYTLQQFLVRYLMVLTLFGDIIYEISEKSRQYDVFIICVRY